MLASTVPLTLSPFTSPFLQLGHDTPPGDVETGASLTFGLPRLTGAEAPAASCETIGIFATSPEPFTGLPRAIATRTTPGDTVFWARRQLGTSAPQVMVPTDSFAGSKVTSKLKPVAVVKPVAVTEMFADCPEQSESLLPTARAAVVVFRLKVTVTVRDCVMDTVQGPVPLQPPPFHPAKTEFASGFGVSVTTVEFEKEAEHAAGQEIPAGTLITVPEPVPFRRTVSVC